MMHVTLNLVLDPDVCIYDAANFVLEGRTDGQADSRSWIVLFQKKKTKFL